MFPEEKATTSVQSLDQWPPPIPHLVETVLKPAPIQDLPTMRQEVEASNLDKNQEIVEVLQELKRLP